MRRSLATSLVAVTLSLSNGALADSTVPFEGDVPSDGLDHFFLSFDVPAGTREIEVQHETLTKDDILDWGLLDAAGFRGWGGGNKEPAVVAEAAASRSYIPGPIAPGPWRVVVGKALIKSNPARYRVTVRLRDAPTLAPQPERRPYSPVGPIGVGARWVAGDFHVHSRESGDASPSLDEIATFARSRGLDFVELSDHNTDSQLSLLADVSTRHPDLLFVPGMEFTTYAGHANAVGATRWVDHKIGQPGVTIDAAADAIEAQGALLSVNHPAFDLGDLCIGCTWKQPLAPARIGAIELGTGSVKKSGVLFSERTFEIWESWLATGAHVPAIGGSDDHSAGKAMGLTDSPIGSPTTMVFVDELTVAGLLAGVRRGRTVVKLDGPADPMIELTSSVAASDDTVRAATVTLRATITGNVGESARFVVDGVALDEVPIDASPFVLERTVAAPATGEARVRVEALVRGKPRSVTSHVFVRRPAEVAATPPSEDDGGCSCATPRRAALDGVGFGGALAFAFAWFARRRGGRAR